MEISLTSAAPLTKSIDDVTPEVQNVRELAKVRATRQHVATAIAH
jgi:hypothetical protein